MKPHFLPGLLVALLLFLSSEKSFAQDIPSCSACFAGQVDLAANPKDPSGNTRVLREDFFFIDEGGTVWKAGKGDVTDGASIPIVFQPIIGGPWEASYLPAAIIHDHYTDEEHHVRAWRDVDRMFYQALIVGHVDAVKAKLMYYAVYVFGAHWGKLASGVYCGDNCIFKKDSEESYRPADYGVSAATELSDVEDTIRHRELEGSPMSLDGLDNLAMNKHPADPFIAK